MKIISSYHQVLILLSILLLQLYTPKIYLGETIVSPDFLLIYLTYLSMLYSRFSLIIFGFLLGITQDFIAQANLIGLFAFTKSIVGFILGSLKKYEKIWKKNIKILFLFLTYQFHFILSSYFMFERSITPIDYILKTSLLQALCLFFILYIINKFILIDNKIIR